MIYFCGYGPKGKSDDLDQESADEMKQQMADISLSATLRFSRIRLESASTQLQKYVADQSDVLSNQISIASVRSLTFRNLASYI